MSDSKVTPSKPARRWTKPTKAELVRALRACERAMNSQVQLCHDRQAQFDDPKVWSRPPDWQAVVAEMYGATAEPLATARALLTRLRGSESAK